MASGVSAGLLSRRASYFILAVALVLMTALMSMQHADAAPTATGDQYPRVHSDFEAFSGDFQDLPADAKEEMLLQYLKKLTAIASRYEPQDNIYNDQMRYRNEKRGIDFGTRRGYSGNLAARYLMGMAFANSPNSPGRK